MPLGLREDFSRNHLEMYSLKANDVAQDICKTQIKLQEIPDIVILALEVAKVWLCHMTCLWYDGNCEKKN